MIIFREYDIDDWSKIDDAVEPFMPLELTKDFLFEISKRGLSITSVEDGNIMACGGITYVNNKEGTVWVKVSRKCLNDSLKWARVIRETFRLMKEVVGDLEISTYILDSFCKGERLARLIGMKRTTETKEHNGNIYNKYQVI